MIKAKEIVTPVTEKKPLPKRGRPRKADKLSNAEKQRAYRVRLRAK